MLEIATFILLCFWLIQVFVERERRIQLSPLLFLILGLLFLSVLAFVNRPSWSSYVAIGEKFVLFFLVVDFIRTKDIVRRLKGLVIWSGVLSAAVAITQFTLFLFGGIVLYFYAPEENLFSVLKPTFLGEMMRATAFFPNPAGLNDYLLFAVPVALFAMFSQKKMKLKALYLLAALLMALAIIFTWSTSALVALFVTALLLFYIYRPSLSIQYSCLLILGGILIYETNLWETVLKPIMGFGVVESVEDRTELLQLGMESLQRNPFVGLGIQNFGSFSGNFFSVGPFIFNYPVHNAFLQMATELGIFGGIIFLGIVAFISIRLVITLSSPLPVEEKGIFKGFCLGWVGVLIHMMSEPMAYGGTLWLILAFIEGAAIVTLRENKAIVRSLQPNRKKDAKEGK